MAAALPLLLPQPPLLLLLLLLLLVQHSAAVRHCWQSCKQQECESGY
jgi:hypothetical protein